uniref:Ribonuclease Z n=1 Tax=Helminthocladia australis TaxID=260093 RepID=A0A1G4NT68_9FLOR|nr:Ribonuclease Z [Helminthocladia australis]SCW21873.1 Ribonuclease Z [Helminthocladia australis]
MHEVRKVVKLSSHLLIKCSQTGQVWLFNCPEGCQHRLSEHKIKIHQIEHIILTSLRTQDISGIIGLLSSLSLNNRVRSINLYGPKGLLEYINLARKYSHTTFRYNLKIRTYYYTCIHKFFPFHLLIYPLDQSSYQSTCNFIEQEKIGRFRSSKARLYGLEPGPLYGNLKLHKKYLLPDGTVLSGKHFTQKYCMGIKLLCSIDNYGFRVIHEVSRNNISTILEINR